MAGINFDMFTLRLMVYNQLILHPLVLSWQTITFIDPAIVPFMFTLSISENNGSFFIRSILFFALIFVWLLEIQIIYTSFRNNKKIESLL
jgi:hypothetical protein